MREKRWLLFGWFDDEPLGGMNDFLGFCMTPQEAVEYFEHMFEAMPIADGHIVDRADSYEQIWTVEKRNGEPVWFNLTDEPEYLELLPQAKEIE